MRVARTLIRWIQPHFGIALLALLMGFLAAGSSVGLMSTSGYLIASAALHPATILLLWTPIVAVRFFGLSRGVFRYLERVFSHEFTFRILSDIRVFVFRGMASLPLSRWQFMKSGDWLQTVMADVDSLQDFYLRVLSPSLVAMLSGLLGSVIVAVVDIRLMVWFALCFVLTGMGTVLLSHQLGAHPSRSMTFEKKNFYTRLVQLVHGMREVLLFNREAAVLSELEEYQHSWTALRKAMIRLEGLTDGLIVSATAFCVWGMLWFAIPMVTIHRITGVSLVVVVLTTLASFESIASLPGAFSYLRQVLDAGNRTLTLVADDGRSSSAGKEQSATSPMNGDLRVHAVSVSWPSSARETVRSVSFEAPWGSKIAIVGPSGSGKSTLANAILGLAPVTAGCIELGGMDAAHMTDLDRERWFTAVLQSPYLFNAPIHQNLKIARPLSSDEDLWEAVNLAAIADRISELPDGFDTLVGEFGTLMSGGERQRLALARALLRKQAILLLDEPTTGLDPIAEERFMESLWKVTQTRTVLVTTHRLVGLDRVDVILVMENGQIVERGTHAGLVAKRGKYWRMLMAQQDMILGVNSR